MSKILDRLHARLGHKKSGETPLSTSELLLGLQLLITTWQHERKLERRRHNIKWAIGVLVLLVGAFTFLHDIGTPPDELSLAQKPFLSIPVSGKGGTAQVAVIPIDGAIEGDDFGPPGLDNTTLYIRTALELALEQGNLSAVVFNITSNGGSAVASAQGYRLIKRFRELSKVPVYAYISSHAYSGGYYLALGADVIVMDPEAQVGSVGVIMSYFNTAKIGELLGVGDVEVATGPLKSCIGQWKTLTPACRAMFQRSVDLAFIRFLTAMSSSRRIPIETLWEESKQSNGRTNGGIFAAEEAIPRNMADKVMTKDEFYLSLAEGVASTSPETKKVDFVRYDMRLGVISEWGRDGKKALKGVTRLIHTLSDTLDARTEMRAE